MKNKDTTAQLKDLLQYVLSNLGDDVTKYELELDNWKVKGWWRNHKMTFTMRLVVTVSGKRYVLSEDEECCYESGCLTCVLPDSSFKLTAGN